MRENSGGIAGKACRNILPSCKESNEISAYRSKGGRSAHLGRRIGGPFESGQEHRAFLDNNARHSLGRESSRKLRMALKGFAVAAVLTTAIASPVASPASAAAAANCQTRAATLWGYGGPLDFKCVGANKTSAIAYAFSAGPWSGAVYTIEDDPYFFCDGASFNIRDRTVYEVYLNATKPARCK
ncbi:hypothetical protein [Microbispora sp. NPDC049125]|uniref:hypothetical protein n=1 Tax=Microbispora sp. NPDC049125 TaxID=3154929 RepID=UPI003466E15E